MRCFVFAIVFTHSSALVGEVDEEKDSTLDFTELRAEPLAAIRY